MMNKTVQVVGRKLIGAAACLAAGLIFAGVGSVAHAQTATVTLPPGVQDVVKLTRAGMSEDVILTQVKNAGATYNLSADQLIYLSKSGVSQNVIKALIVGNGSTPAAAPVATAPATVPPPPTAAIPPAPATVPAAPVPAPQPAAAPGAPPATYDSFHDQLAPYGSWVNVSGYGWCWRPTVAAFDATWQPYGSAGHWIYTDNGWYWESDYPWGQVAFHYGRWYRDSLGWLWVPGYDWAPAWVAWRHSEGYVGWAPLPPGAVFRAGVGLEFGGRVGLDLDFGLGLNAFVFVGYDHFWDHDLHGYFMPHDRAEFVFRHSVVMNGYRFDHGRFVVEGLGRDRIALYTHHDVWVEAPRHDFHGRIVVEDRRGFHDDRRFGHDHDHGRF